MKLTSSMLRKDMEISFSVLESNFMFSCWQLNNFSIIQSRVAIEKVGMYYEHTFYKWQVYIQKNNFETNFLIATKKIFWKSGSQKENPFQLEYLELWENSIFNWEVWFEIPKNYTEFEVFKVKQEEKTLSRVAAVESSQ